MRIVLFFLFACVLIKTDAQIDTIQWAQLSPLPDSIQNNGFGYFLIDSDFYVAGGWLGSSSTTTSSVWRYHIPSDLWYRMNNLPFGAASSTCSFVLNGMGYFLTATDSISNGSCDRMFWQYNPTNDSWTRKSDFPDSPRQDNSFFVIGGKGYVGQTNGCIEFDEHFWQYDPVSDSWTQIAALPALPMILNGSTAIGTLSSGYLFGGSDQNGVFYNNIWRYDLSLNQWNNIGNIQGMGRENPVIWGFDSVFIIGGGILSDSNSTTKLADDYYEYNISQNSWIPVVFLNSFDSTCVGASFVFNKKGYYYGGLDRYTPNFTYSNKLWSFDASKYIHDTTTGIVNINPEPSFSVYPNPSHSPSFSISTSESGDVIFSDALGRVIDERRLKQGVNQIRLTTDDQIVFYHATLQYGTTANGKVVFLR